MASSDSSSFLINSDFPLPVQTVQKTEIVHVPSGTPTSPTAHLYKDVYIGENATMFRMAVKSSRNDMIIPSLGQGLSQFEGDARFSAYLRVVSSGTVRCEVYVEDQGIDFPSPGETTSDNDFTFYISGFKIP